MIYKIVWCEVKKKGNTNGRDWAITEMNLEDPEGNTVEKVSTFDSVQNGGTIEGTILKNDKGYLNFKKLEAPDFIKNQRGGAYKEKVIGEAMEKKSQNIKEAQDRSAWMWAKTNASTLLGTSMATETNDDIAKAVIGLATKIYNGEPQVPF